MGAVGRHADKAGAARFTHADIARLVHERFGLSGWWSQSVTVGYERLTGRREPHQRPDGYSISVSKTVAAPLATLFAAWHDFKRRSRWLPDAVTLRKATPNKSMRLTWKDGQTILAVGFYPKGEDKAQVTLEHPRLKSKAEAARVQAYWRKTLDKLRAMLEG
jgi:uncharacterized protein YndB with AHSA1/START domain